MDLFDLLIIAFILLPVLEGIFGKKAREKRKQDRPRPPSSSGLPRYGTSDDEEEGAQATPRSAGDMVPDDLWELLTGERRAPTRTEPEMEPASPEPWETPELEEADRGLERWEADLEPAMEPVEYEPLEERNAGGPVSAPPGWPRADRWERAGDRGSLERTDLPEAYSLEGPVPPERVRHAAFHRKLAALPPAALARGAPRARDLGLDGPAALRRAVVLREVLGPPKGLQ